MNNVNPQHLPADTLVTSMVDRSEIESAAESYVNSTEQPLTYEATIPDYARLIANLIGSMSPDSVLEFGCNAGRNLDLIQKAHSSTKLVGVDLNPASISAGKKLFDLDLQLGNERWLEQCPTDSFDVAFTVSVIDHIPYPEPVLRDLLRISRHYLVLFELAHDRVGKATHNLFVQEGMPSLKPVFRYSYTHNYRYEIESKLGARCLLDAYFPIGETNLLDLYHLYVFTKRSASAFGLMRSVTWQPITTT